MKFNNRLKLFFWDLESIFYEVCARLLPAKPASAGADLPAPVVVSLTSYSRRFDKLHLTIKTLIRQNVRPEKIVLWVSYDDYESIPSKVSNLSRENDFFEIRACDDIKSYKKLVPTIQSYPHWYIVTADDDVFYPRHWLRYLVQSVRAGKCIVAHRAHRPVFIEGKMAPYTTWEHSVKRDDHGMILPTGIGGILYSPGALAAEVFNSEKFMRLAPSADDIWFFWMGRLNGSKYILTESNLNLVSWYGSSKGGLAELNVERNGNDLAIENMEREYGLINQTMGAHL